MRALAILLCTMLATLAVAGADVAAADPGAQPLSLALSVDRDRLYQGETLLFHVTLHSHGVSISNIGFPGVESAAGAEFSAPEEIDGESAEGPRSYRFRGRLANPGAGPMQLGPATLECDVPESEEGGTGFFGGVARRRVRAQSGAAAVTVMPLPASGRPTEFAGAVGNFTMNVSATPRAVPAGDPVTVTTIISGEGNLAAASCPELSAPEVKGYPARRRYLSGKLLCEQVIVPRSQAVLPPVRWSFFDPKQSAYLTLTQPVQTTVGPAGSVTRAATFTQPPPAKPASHAPRHSLPLLPALAIGSSAILALSAWRTRERQRLQPPAEPAGSDAVPGLAAEAGSALDEGDVDKFYSAVFRILQLLAARRCGIGHAASLASLPPGDAGVAPELSALFSRCQEVRYGRVDLHRAQMKHDLNLLQNHLAG